MDGDGDLDAFLGMYEEGALQLLLINDGTGRFTSVSLEENGFVPWGASFGDLNGDGRLDLYIATYSAPLETEKLMSGAWLGPGKHYLRVWLAEGGVLPESG